MSFIPSLRPWTHFHSDRNYRKNTSVPFTHHGLDNKIAFDGNQRKFPDVKTYGENDILYTYNSQGYRSDEWTPETCQFLFAGCSFTEGEALPLEAIWPSLVLRRIKDQYNVSAPLHSVARGGLSPNGIVRKVFGAFTKEMLRPKILFVLFPNIFRDERYYGNFSNVYHPHDYIPGWNTNFTTNITENTYYHKQYEKQVLVSNVVNDFYKNVLFLDTICLAYNCHMIFSTWQYPLPVSELTSDNLSDLPAQYIRRFHHNNERFIDMNKLIKDHMPALTSSTFYDGEFPHNPEEKYQIHEQTIARDYAHPGPNSHEEYADKLFNFPAVQNSIQKILG